jgi:hypothetical protein
MRPFNHINAKTVDEAVTALGSGKNKAIAGGTDLLGTLKSNILPTYPAAVVNLKTITGLEYIKEEDGTLKIGALTKLADVAADPAINSKYTALAQAAKAVATPNVRNMGTLGGNITQLNRCWYFRKAENRFNCIRKDGSECFAALGDNRYHSIFGGVKIHASPCTQECPAERIFPHILPRSAQATGMRQPHRHEGQPAALHHRPRLRPFLSDKCNRCNTDESVGINNVERTLGDYILDNCDKFYQAPVSENGKSVAIVGSGPSGLSAAFYLRKAGNKVTVYDTKEEAGGMLMYAIPAYRLPKGYSSQAVKLLKAWV